MGSGGVARGVWGRHHCLTHALSAPTTLPQGRTSVWSTPCAQPSPASSSQEKALRGHTDPLPPRPHSSNPAWRSSRVGRPWGPEPPGPGDQAPGQEHQQPPHAVTWAGGQVLASMDTKAQAQSPDGKVVTIVTSLFSETKRGTGSAGEAGRWRGISRALEEHLVLGSLNTPRLHKACFLLQSHNLPAWTPHAWGWAERRACPQCRAGPIPRKDTGCPPPVTSSAA